MSRQKTKRELKVSQARASPSNPQLDEILFQSKIHATNSIGELVRIEIFNHQRWNQYSGLLLNSLIRQTDEFVSFTLINGGIGVNEIKIPLNDFKDETKTRMTQMRSLIEPHIVKQFIPVNKKGKYTLNSKSIREIIKISMEELKEILLK